jgi:DNA-binding CsgD family transcriptional regulator
MISWDTLTTALDELETVRAQLSQARAQERTARFYHLLRTRMIGANRGEHLANVIELSQGWVIVHWLHDPKSVALYSSSLSMRQALGVGGDVILSLVDSSERSVHDTRRATTRLALEPMQKKVLIALSHGMSDRQIAESLSISVPWAKKLLGRGYRVIGAASRVQAALLVRDLELSDDNVDS